MRYFLLGVGIGLLLSSLLLIYKGQETEVIHVRQEEGLVVRVVLLGGEVEKEEELHYLTSPSLVLPPPVEVEEEEIEEEEEEIEVEEEEIEDLTALEEPFVEPELIVISIPYTTPVSRIIELLLQAELIEDGQAFLAKIIEMGVSHLLQAGEHTFVKGSETQEIINILLGRRGEDL